MKATNWIGLAVVVTLAATGCAKRKVELDPETCGRFGDAAGRCTVGAIEGRVLLDGATAHAGATVSVVGTDRRATTAADGSFSLEKLPPGDHVVSMAAEGYVPHTVSAKVRSEAATRLADVTLEKATVARLGGRFLLAGRTTHANTVVTVEGTGISVFTAADGAWSFEKVPFGAARITARHAGFVPVTIDLEIDRAVVDAADRTLDALPAPGSVAGVVTARGIPREGVVMALAGTEFDALTGVDGGYAIEGVEPGTYELVAVAPGYLPYTIAVDVISGTATTVITIDLVPGQGLGSLRGRATRLGEPARGGIDVLLKDGDAVVARGTSDETGAYRLGDAPVGIYSLEARAEGFPPFIVPAVALGPGEWDGPEVVMRRSVRIDTRSGHGSTTPSGRKAILSYQSGSEGTFLWDADTGRQRKVLAVRADLLASDRAETFATLLTHDNEDQPALVNLDLATGETALVMPRPDRILYSYGASTFYRDEDGAIHRVVSTSPIAKRIEIDGLDTLSIMYAEGDTLWFTADIWDEATFWLPFHADADWSGPPMDEVYGATLEATVGVVAMPERQAVWVDVPGRRVVPISTGMLGWVFGSASHYFVLDDYDPYEGADVRMVDAVTGEMRDLLAGVVNVWTAAERSVFFQSADGAFFWLPDEGGSAAVTRICSGGAAVYSSEALVCLDEESGALRVADDDGVRTIDDGASDFVFVSDDVIAWSRTGDSDVLRLARTDGSQHVIMACAGGMPIDQAGFGEHQYVKCADGAWAVDLAAERVTRISAELPTGCTISHTGDAALCLHDTPCGGRQACLRAYDLRNGETASAGTPTSLHGSLFSTGLWSESGRAAVFADMFGEGFSQIRFPDDGEPGITHCNPSAPSYLWALDDEARALLWTPYEFYFCDREGNVSHVGPMDWFDRRTLGRSGWSVEGGSIAFHFASETWMTTDGWRAWWVPPGGDDAFVVDSPGLRAFRRDGSIDLLADYGEPMPGFGRVPLLRTPSGVERVTEDGTLEMVAAASWVEYEWFGEAGVWILAGTDDTLADLHVVDLNSGAVDRVASNVDLELLFAPLFVPFEETSLFFNGEVDGVPGLYRLAEGSTLPVRLLDRADDAYYDGHVWFYDGDLAWVLHGDAMLLVHDAPVYFWSEYWERGLVFTSDRELAPGTWWFGLPQGGE